MKCNICYKPFCDMHSLLSHVTISHPLQRSYTCFNEDCYRKFLCIESLKSHIYKCPYLLFKSISHINKDPIETSLLTFISKLYSNNSIANSVIQEIISNMMNFTEDMKKFHLQKIIAITPPETHDKIRSLFSFNNFINLNTERRRTTYLKTLKVFIPPEKILIGEIDNDKNLNGTTIRTKKKCFAEFASMRDVLKYFLELPNVLTDIIRYMNEEIAKNDKSNWYTSLFQGTIWREAATKFKGKIVLPYYIYYDEFGVGDPLSPAATLHKMGGLYYSIAALPPKFSSAVDNVLFAQMIYYSDYKEFKNAKCFCKLISELKHLATNGVQINVDNKSQTVYFVLVGVLGDNLATNSLLGFNQSFSSNHYCRFCRASKDDAQKLCDENKQLIRDEKNYDDDLKSLSFGIKEKCVFNDVPHFHNIKNKTCDILHDFYLGICRYDMAKIIKYLINEKFITLDDLNDRLRYFDYCENDHGNKLTAISDKHISQGYIIITGAEMSFLVTYFGIVIGDCVPENDPVWIFYLVLFDLINLVNADCFSPSDLRYLQTLIKTHNELYIKLFNGNLTAKFHILTHYPRIIEAMGPVKHLSCSKFESFHQKSRKYAHVVHSRVNVCHSLANKLQLELSYRFLSNEGFKTSIEFGQADELPLNLPESPLYEVSYLKIHGKVFRMGYAIYLHQNNDDDPIFGIISHIVTNKEKRIYFIYKEASTIGFNNHIKGYLVKLPSINTFYKLYNFNTNNYIKPLKIHVTANGANVITAREYQ